MLGNLQPLYAFVQVPPCQSVLGGAPQLLPPYDGAGGVCSWEEDMEPLRGTQQAAWP